MLNSSNYLLLLRISYGCLGIFISSKLWLVKQVFLHMRWSSAYLYYIFLPIVVATFMSFQRMFNQAQEENRKQLEFERKKAEKEAREKQRTRKQTWYFEHSVYIANWCSHISAPGFWFNGRGSTNREMCGRCISRVWVLTGIQVCYLSWEGYKGRPIIHQVSEMESRFLSYQKE